MLVSSAISVGESMPLTARGLYHRSLSAVDGKVGAETP